MTPERQNEIWAMLPIDFKEQLCYDYNQANIALLQDPTNVRIDAHKRFLEEYFGSHNLTAQAEEKPLFKSNYKAGDKVVITGSLCRSRGEAITLVRQYDCPREANDYNKLWVGQFEDGHTCSIAERHFTPTVEFEQAGEKPKKGLLDRMIDAGYNFLDRHNPDVISERGATDIDYAQYRLNLAKEIVVAMINEDWSSVSVTATAIDAVDMANEIVKRLKETEE